jgi:hypothetical protein
MTFRCIGLVYRGEAHLRSGELKNAAYHAWALRIDLPQRLVSGLRRNGSRPIVARPLQSADRKRTCAFCKEIAR